MDTKNKNNKTEKDRNDGCGCASRSFEKMSEMMKDCSKNEATPSDCCSMMKNMMGFDKGRETNQEQATETPSK